MHWEDTRGVSSPPVLAPARGNVENLCLSLNFYCPNSIVFDLCAAQKTYRHKQRVMCVKCILRYMAHYKGFKGVIKQMKLLLCCCVLYGLLQQIIVNMIGIINNCLPHGCIYVCMFWD